MLRRVTFWQHVACSQNLQTAVIFAGLLTAEAVRRNRNPGGGSLAGGAVIEKYKLFQLVVWHLELFRPMSSTGNRPAAPMFLAESERSKK